MVSNLGAQETQDKNAAQEDVGAGVLRLLALQPLNTVRPQRITGTVESSVEFLESVVEL
jgi:hypothetical protein